MRRKGISSIRWLIVLASVITLVVAPILVCAQEVESVEPSEGQPGQELTITLRGNGFSDDARVRIGDFEIQSVQFVNTEEIRVRVRIPEDAPPGPRDVQVDVGVEGQEPFSIMREGGFTVLESPGEPTTEPRPGPGPDPGPDPDPYPPDPIDWWLVILIVIVVGVIVVGGGALTVSLAVRARRTMLKKQTQMQQEMQQAQQELEQLQEQAEEGELPEKCQSGKIKVIRDKPELKPGSWKVAGLQVTLYDEAQAQQGGAQRAEKRGVPEELVKRVDKAARNKLLWGDSEKLAAEIVDVGQALAAQVIAWQARSGGGRDVCVEPEITGGEGSVKFTLYRCVGEPEWWQKIKSWTVKAQAVKHFSQEFRGPTAGEAPEAYRAMLEKGITIYVRNLVCEASRLWDTEGIGVSVEISLK